MDAHSHSRRNQKRHEAMAFQSNIPSRASSAASLGVGLGVRDTRFEANSYLPGIVEDESSKEALGTEETSGGYM